MNPNVLTVNISNYELSNYIQGLQKNICSECSRDICMAELALTCPGTVKFCVEKFILRPSGSDFYTCSDDIYTK